MTSDHCIRCNHYQWDFKCDAFPDGIPDEILSGDNDHTEPYPGDNDIQFEPLSVK
jgi:hypothetical protein